MNGAAEGIEFVTKYVDKDCVVASNCVHGGGAWPYTGLGDWAYDVLINKMIKPVTITGKCINGTIALGKKRARLSIKQKHGGPKIY